MAALAEAEREGAAALEAARMGARLAVMDEQANPFGAEPPAAANPFEAAGGGADPFAGGPDPFAGGDDPFAQDDGPNPFGDDPPAPANPFAQPPAAAGSNPF